MNQQLSTEQIDNLWKLYKDNGDIYAKNDLLLHYHYLVKWIVRRMIPWLNNHNNYDDIVCNGVLGLNGAIVEYNSQQDINFKIFATDRIRAEILDYINAVDWASPDLREKINALNLAIEIPYAEKPLENEKKFILLEIIDELPKKEQTIFTLYYFDDMTVIDIANLCHVSETFVEETHNNVLMKMRARLDSQNLL